ncbi:HlyD family type I secretion periplasmic adaptor subunit [Paucibacter sp. XJ19-41]|uniref:HlyD family type I secretion periplasmic adaptor subunit n=1 Tax=Paucibacter sp. XJ19-41 TaxID=2927824 RepID=UPI00234A3174|nr:HlyD family type I secretion periplasmic adaptor subunit [Paucibacter sp. XJ19-41]MDC6168284.1 HlyD family type I secretion periplasmic adaptor subunit [Paucibacter sp. XJ19-41]
MSAAVDSTGTAARHPARELLARYGAIFKAAWAHRDQLAGPKRLADERAFLPATLALQETPPHPAPRRAIFVICSLFVIALLWAIFGKIDIVAVAQGRIIVSERSKTIQPLETSVVKSIHVKDGDKVQAGQLLIALDATATQADANRVGQERGASVSDLLRAQALLASLDGGGMPRLPETQDLTSTERLAAQAQLASDWADISAKLSKLDAEIARRRAEIATVEQQVSKLQTTLPLAQQRERDYQGLAEQGFMAGHAGQDRRRERIELERDLATALARRSETQAALKESEQSRSAYRAETQRALRELLTQAQLKSRQLGEEASKADKRNALTQLTAPVAGTVQQLAVHTAGGVVTEAQVLLVLVPDDAEVTAEVVLENKDVGFVREGQAAEIKLETFPFTRYGTVAAEVKSISADAVNDEKRGAIFPATLVLKQSTLAVDGKTIRLAPGMNLTAEIKTGKRRVIDFLLSPVQKHVDESLKER